MASIQGEKSEVSNEEMKSYSRKKHKKKRKHNLKVASSQVFAQINAALLGGDHEHTVQGERLFIRFSGFSDRRTEKLNSAKFK